LPWFSSFWALLLSRRHDLLADASEYVFHSFKSFPEILDMTSSDQHCSDVFRVWKYLARMTSVIVLVMGFLYPLDDEQ